MSGSTAPPDRSALHRGVALESDKRSRDPYQRIWIKADGTLPDDPLLHACVVTYASDMSLH